MREIAGRATAPSTRRRPDRRESVMTFPSRLRMIIHDATEKEFGRSARMTKQRFNRRDFMGELLGLTGAGIAGVAGAEWPLGRALAAIDAPQEPDLVVFNAKVYTVDASAPKVEAFAVRAGRF